jgi:hypothetical protein
LKPESSLVTACETRSFRAPYRVGARNAAPRVPVRLPYCEQLAESALVETTTYRGICRHSVMFPSSDYTYLSCSWRVLWYELLFMRTLRPSVAYRYDEVAPSQNPPPRHCMKLISVSYLAFIDEYQPSVPKYQYPLVAHLGIFISLPWGSAQRSPELQTQ